MLNQKVSQMAGFFYWNKLQLASGPLVIDSYVQRGIDKVYIVLKSLLSL
jgi:hypothetical protein